MSRVIIHPNTLAIWYGNHVYNNMAKGIQPMEITSFEQQLTEKLNSPN